MKTTIKINNRQFTIEFKVLFSGKKILETVRNINGDISNSLSVRDKAKKYLETIHY